MNQEFIEIKREYHSKTIEIANKAIELLEALEDDTGAIDDLKERVKHSEDVLRRMD